MEFPLNHPGALVENSENTEPLPNSINPTDLTATLYITGTYEEQQARLAQLEQQKKDLETEQKEILNQSNKTLQDLLKKKQEKERAIAGTKVVKAACAAQLAALKLEKERKIAEINNDIEKQATQIQARQEKSENEAKNYECALQTINAKIEKAQTAQPSKGLFARLLGY